MSENYKLPTTGDEIREAFLRFFEEKDHKRLPSSSLVPQGDPTLLFTSAGMVQFKPYFTGEARPPAPRLTTCQKCFRTTDIDVVGDTKHLTFFEMLGNFSVGDYFKREAIAFAWEFVTQRLRLPKEKLWITVFLDDDEAFGYWHEDQGVPTERILRYGEKENFWGPAGETGPCGPCSEIHYDYGPEVPGACGRAECGPDCSCARFLEIWNLVFMQYYQDAAGKRTPLPRPNIDTGMGLERTAAVMQGKLTAYDTDLFQPIIQKIEELCGHRYGENEATDKAMRVVAEHTRAAAFLIADGIIPSNEGRGYVLRRIIRRAIYFGEKLFLTPTWHPPGELQESPEGEALRRGVEDLSRRRERWEKEPFLPSVVASVITLMGNVYFELREHKDFVMTVVRLEEERFRKTLDFGRLIVSDMVILHYDVTRYLRMQPVPGLAAIKTAVIDRTNELDLHPLVRKHFVEPLLAAGTIDDLNKLHPERISGQELFTLYDTYGFPKELTKEIVSEESHQSLTIDEEGYEREMEAQRERARAAAKFGLGEGGSEVYASLNLPPTEFLGYETMQSPATVLALLVDGVPVQSADEGQQAEIILHKTPFYGEMGGQVGDTGQLLKDDGTRIVITDSYHPVPEIIAHRGVVARGSISIDDTVLVEVDEARRWDIRRNHTATHLLQAALRQVLGTHVRQTGSLVAPDRLRFDFSHIAPMTAEELAQVQRQVNEKIRENITVDPHTTSYAEAMSQGVIAFFGDKYGDQVRVVEVPGYSAELCGGTHVDRTGDIGFFLITSEASIGAGVRRIEAVTGRGAEALVAERLASLESAAQRLQTSPQDIPGRIDGLLSEMDRERKRAAALQRQVSKADAESLLSQVSSVNGVKVLAAQVSVPSMEALRELGDMLRDRLGSGVVVLGTVHNDKPQFLAMVTKDLTAQGVHAGNIIKQVASLAGGGGGGRPEMAQAGGKDVTKLDEALSLVPRLVSFQRKDANAR